MAKWEELPIAELKYRGIIYKYTSPSNKVYIGQTINEKNRKRQHRESALRGEGFYFHAAIRKYGYENFKYEIIFEIRNNDLDYTKKVLNDREKYFIALYESTNREKGYNLCKGGDGIVGHKMSEKQKELLRSIHKGKPLSKEHRLKISISNKGNKATFPNGNPKAINGLKRKAKEKRILVEQYNKKTFILINKYNSICEASDKTGINASHISECINSKRKSAGGFIWIVGIN